ncbi:MAG TPA: hypothetical protein VMF64_14545 [Steroidobacteraceae bacterium]|nr:hypothetical protein [Steroidobacteraceae bacterium]
MDPNQNPRTAALIAAGCGALLALAAAGSAYADASPAVTVGAGAQAGFFSCNTACINSPGVVASGDSSVQGFALNSMRLYVNGSITDQIKLTFDTEYTGTGTGAGANKIGVLDGIARFEFSNVFNVWVGRFLPPSDRANLYGPYYANDWAPYADGVADYYPGVFVGRDDGLAYWGQFGIVKVQLGAFDGESLNSAAPDPSRVLGAARVMIDLWDPEPGYYLNGTYYGDKNVLAFGVSGQTQDSRTTATIDGLMERKLGDLGVLDIESEYMKDNRLTAADGSDGWYALVSYLLPQTVGIGRIQPLVRFADKKYDDVDSHLKTTEVDINYVIKEFNARVGLYYLHQTVPAAATAPTSAPITDHEWGLKVQLQM